MCCRWLSVVSLYVCIHIRTTSVYTVNQRACTCEYAYYILYKMQEWAIAMHPFLYEIIEPFIPLNFFRHHPLQTSCLELVPWPSCTSVNQDPTHSFPPSACMCICAFVYVCHVYQCLPERSGPEKKVLQPNGYMANLNSPRAEHS
jgi:hypothetical protein